MKPTQKAPTKIISRKQETQPYPRWRWYPKGECVVEVLRRGHFPTTLMVRLPNDQQIEVDADELEGVK